MEKETLIEGKIAPHLGERLSEFLEIPEDADGEAAEAGDVLRSEAGPD